MEQDEKLGVEKSFFDTRIKNEAYTALINSVFGTAGRPVPITCVVGNSVSGQYNYCRFVTVHTGDQQKEYVIKISLSFTEARKVRVMRGHRHTLECEASLLREINDRTNLPAPKMIAYCTTVNNPLGYPYIMTEKLPGEPSCMIWQEGQRDEPSEATEACRVNFLKSLASVMSELGKLGAYTGLGMPLHRRGRPVEMRDSYVLRGITAGSGEPENYEVPLLIRKPGSTLELFKFRDGRLPWSQPDGEEATEKKWRGLERVMNMILSSPTLAQSEETTFVIAHNNLDLQNILVDKDGNVTGVLDWDGCTTVPRCMGYASVPVFLQDDWSGNFSIHNKNTVMLWKFEHYREIYAKEMERVGCTDARYTRYSPVYHGLLNAMQEDDQEGVLEIVGKLFCRVPALRNAAVDEVLEVIGNGENSGEALLRHLARSLEDILDPTDTADMKPPTHAATPATEATFAMEEQGVVSPPSARSRCAAENAPNVGNVVS